MGAIAQLTHTTLDVEPGHTAMMAMTVRNTGTVVDRFTFEALGSVAPWVTFAPASLSLFPEASGTVNIIIAPPRDPAVSAGGTPLGLRVVSSEDPTGSVVEETTINIGAFSDIGLELVPRVARGRRLARTQLAVDNRSNCSYRAELSGSDPQGTLRFAFRPSVVDVPPGAAIFAKVAIRPTGRFWRGPEKTNSFRLTLTNDPLPLPVAARGTGADKAPVGKDSAPGGPPTPAGGTPPAPGSPAPGTPPPPSVPPPPGAGSSDATAPVPVRPTSPHQDEIIADGTMLQEAMLPRWVFPVVAALVALAAILVILWFVLIRPQVRSTAKDQVNKQLAANGITPVTTPGGTPSGTGGGTGGGSGSGSGGGAGSSTVTAPPTGTGGGSGGGTTGSGTTVNGVQQATGNGIKVIFAVPSGKSLEVTDLLVENSAGDTGNLVLARNGTPVMQWAMANFRDLDYHWITPTVFAAGTQMQLIVTGCTGACTPAIYYAGHLVSG